MRPSKISSGDKKLACFLPVASVESTKSIQMSVNMTDCDLRGTDSLSSMEACLTSILTLLLLAGFEAVGRKKLMDGVCLICLAAGEMSFRDWCYFYVYES